MISASRRGVSRDYLSRAQKAGKDIEGAANELKGAPVSKSKPSKGDRPRLREEEKEPAGVAAPQTPPSPPLQRRFQESKGKGKSKGKYKHKGEKDQAPRKKKNKGLKRGPWWQGYLESRAARRARTEETGEAIEEVTESPPGEVEREGDVELSERLARWSDATEEAGS